MRLSSLLAALALASACTGQSGSEAIDRPAPDPDAGEPAGPVPPGIPPAPHCPCDALRDQQQIRATVLAVEAIEPFTNVWRYQLRADEILSELASNGGEPQAGDRFGGYWNGNLACGNDVQPPFEIGAQVLAFYRRGRQDGVLCCEYLACSDTCEPENEDNAGPGTRTPYERCLADCESQNATACAEHREEALMRGELMLVAWADELVVGTSEHATVTIAIDELPALALDRDACMAAIDDRYETLHPPDPPEPMEDGADGDAPAPGGPPRPMPPPEAELPMSTPSASEPAPDAGTAGAGAQAGTPPPPANPSSEAPGPPPAHPEEVRVRCR